MLRLPILALCIAMAAIPGSAMAQDAAETGAILAGSRGTGESARSVGTAARGSMGGAADAIAASRSGRSGAASARRPAAAGGRRQAAAARREPAGYTIAGDIDVLDRFDVPTWRLVGGRTLRVSGELVPTASTICLSGCDTRN